MPLVTFSVRMDEEIKKEFDSLCTEFGMNTSTAINIFARAVVRERKIPFEIKALNTKQNEETIVADGGSTATASKKAGELHE